MNTAFVAYITALRNPLATTAAVDAAAVAYAAEFKSATDQASYGVACAFSLASLANSITSGVFKATR
jgi:hypothetical protein